MNISDYSPEGLDEVWDFVDSVKIKTVRDLTDQEIIDRMDQIRQTQPTSEDNKDELQIQWNTLNAEMYRRHTPEHDERNNWPEPIQH